MASDETPGDVRTRARVASATAAVLMLVLVAVAVAVEGRTSQAPRDPPSTPAPPESEAPCDVHGSDAASAGDCVERELDRHLLRDARSRPLGPLPELSVEEAQDDLASWINELEGSEPGTSADPGDAAPARPGETR